MSQHKNPCPRDYENNNINEPFLGHHYCILILSSLCLCVDKRILKKIMHFYYMTYGRALTQDPLPRGVMKFTNMVVPSCILTI